MHFIKQCLDAERAFFFSRFSASESTWPVPGVKTPFAVFPVHISLRLRPQSERLEQTSKREASEAPDTSPTPALLASWGEGGVYTGHRSVLRSSEKRAKQPLFGRRNDASRTSVTNYSAFYLLVQLL